MYSIAYIKADTSNNIKRQRKWKQEKQQQRL